MARCTKVVKSSGKRYLTDRDPCRNDVGFQIIPSIDIGGGGADMSRYTQSRKMCLKTPINFSPTKGSSSSNNNSSFGKRKTSSTTVPNGNVNVATFYPPPKRGNKFGSSIDSSSHSAKEEDAVASPEEDGDATVKSEGETGHSGRKRRNGMTYGYNEQESDSDVKRKGKIVKQSSRQSERKSLHRKSLNSKSLSVARSPSRPKDKTSAKEEAHVTSSVNENGPITRQKSRGKTHVLDNDEDEDEDEENSLRDEEEDRDVMHDKRKLNSRLLKKFLDMPDSNDKDELRDLSEMKKMLKSYQNELNEIKNAVTELNEKQKAIRLEDDDKGETDEDNSEAEGSHHPNGGANSFRQAKKDITMRNNRFRPYERIEKRFNMIEQTLQRTTLKVHMNETRLNRLELKYHKLHNRYRLCNRLVKESAKEHNEARREALGRVIANLKENLINMLVGFTIGATGVSAIGGLWYYFF